MAQMNISLPAKLKSYVESRVSEGSYASSSDYIRDLVRRDQEYEIKRERLHAAIEEGRASGISERSVEDIIADRKKQIKKEANAKRKDAA